METKQFKYYKGIIRYHRTDDLKQDSLPDGKEVYLKALFIAGDDERFSGDMIYEVAESHYWLPQRDLNIIGEVSTSEYTSAMSAVNEADLEIKLIRFITNNLMVDRFPVSKDIRDGGKYGDCNVIINVSDEFYLGNSEEIMKRGKLNYYFPLGESGDSMGLNSIFGALQVLHSIYQWNPEWKILIHCQAGANRSPTVKAAFYYMMLGRHLPEKKEGGLIMKPNQLLWNIEKGRLPDLQKMELFLSKSKFAFDNPEKFFGGMFDWVMSESGCSNQ